MNTNRQVGGGVDIELARAIEQSIRELERPPAPTLYLVPRHTVDYAPFIKSQLPERN